MEILSLIRGRVPLLIEVKSRGPEAAAASRAVEEALTGYHGPVGVMSFNPTVPRWFAAHAPVRLRGLVLGRRHLWLKALAGIAARPEFLACDVGALPSHLLAAARRRGIPVIAWTCRTREDRRIAETQADQIIFEPEN